VQHVPVQKRLLAVKLFEKVFKTNKSSTSADSASDLPKCRFVLTHCEVNTHQGVGALLLQLFPDDRGIINIRSRDLYGGTQDFAAHSFAIDAQTMTHQQIIRSIINQIGNTFPTEVLAVPYFPEDFKIAVAIKKYYDTKLCTYIMDDQNIYTPAVPDEQVRSLLEASDLCYGISKPLCKAYEGKYGMPFHFMPALIKQDLICNESVSDNRTEHQAHGVLIGNIWSQDWLNRLRSTLRSSGTSIEWYGNPNRAWLEFNDDDLVKDGIHFKGFKEHQELIPLLKRASFGIILAGDSNTEKERPELTYLSLPSRISYLIATAHLPLIVLGDNESAATQFVLENEIGLASSYETEDFKQAVAKLLQPDQHAYFRRMAARLAPHFSASRFEAGLWTSLQTMKPIEFMSQRRTVVVTPNEVNDRHGTGVMVKRLFKTQTDNLISIRTKDDYSGEHQLGQMQIQMENSGKYRSDIYRTILLALNNKTLDHIVCVPYYEDDLKTAIALKDLFDASLAIYIMDDQNCEIGVISDATMQEALEKADIRFATHGELRDAYENKYRLKFWVLPCVIPQQLVGQFSTTPAITKSNGLLIGSLWSAEWFRQLAETLEGAGQTVDWFGNHTASWIQNLLDIHKGTVIPKGLISEEELVEALKEYPYLIIPTGGLDEQDDQPHLTKLSLPGRIIFAAASSGIPIIVVGSAKSSAAAFVKRFDLGLVVNYDASEFLQAASSITEATAQEHFRQKALEMSFSFSDQGLLNWLYNSIDLKQPADDRFDRHFTRGPVDLVQYIEPPVPTDIYHDFIPVYQALAKLKIKGYEADFIIDVGCSFGIWSYTASKHYPEAQFYLIDPLMSSYSKGLRDEYQSKLKYLTLGEMALSNQNGKTRFNLAPDLYGSSLMNPADFRTYEGIEVDVKTLDTYAAEQNITGRGILKLDVQCAEHLIVDGARNFLSQIDAIVIELSLIRYDENSLVYAEMIQLMDQLGFRYFDETGEWRSPQNGVLLQKELLFTRKDLLNEETSRTIQ